MIQGTTTLISGGAIQERYALMPRRVVIYALITPNAGNIPQLKMEATVIASGVSNAKGKRTDTAERKAMIST